MNPGSRNRLRAAISIVVVLLCGLLGGWLVQDIQESTRAKPRAHAPSPEPRETEAAPASARHAKRDRFKNDITVQVMASSRPMETILRFPSEGSYESFLGILESAPVRVIDRLDRLQAVRVGYDDVEDLDALLSGEDLSVYPSISRMPDRIMTGNGVQGGAVGSGDQALPWSGLTGDRAKFGAGVRIAVLDSGIVAHENLPGGVKSVAIEPFPDNPAEIHGHGTAVASLIAGAGPLAPGVAPAVELISIRVTDARGTADSFTIAAGMLAAMDEGAHIINLSMGTYEDSPLMAEAVRMAQERGVVVVAASGNDGQEDAAYPAAYPGVISVGAVDARGAQLDFSNFGSYLSLTAPGYQVNAAWPGNQYVRLSGTSVSAPLVAGSIAAVMSPGNGIVMSAAEAAGLVMEFTDEAGIPGPDSQYGSGILNLPRVLSRNRPGIVDVAITHQQLVPARNHGNELLVTVQNRGTVNLLNTILTTTVSGVSRKTNVTSIPPNALHTYSVPLPGNISPPFRIDSQVSTGTPGTDATPWNNQRGETFDLR